MLLFDQCKADIEAQNALIQREVTKMTAQRLQSLEELRHLLGDEIELAIRETSINAFKVVYQPEDFISQLIWSHCSRQSSDQIPVFVYEIPDIAEKDLLGVIFKISVPKFERFNYNSPIEKIRSENKDLKAKLKVMEQKLREYLESEKSDRGYLQQDPPKFGAPVGAATNMGPPKFGAPPAAAMNTGPPKFAGQATVAMNMGLPKFGAPADAAMNLVAQKFGAPAAAAMNTGPPEFAVQAAAMNTGPPKFAVQAAAMNTGPPKFAVQAAAAMSTGPQKFAVQATDAMSTGPPKFAVQAAAMNTGPPKFAVQETDAINMGPSKFGAPAAGAIARLRRNVELKKAQK